MKRFINEIHEPLAMHYRVNAGYIPPDHWVNDEEQGGGRILGEMCHFVDFVCFLAGACAVEVQAQSLGNAGQYSADNVIATLKFANSTLATISYLANGDKSASKERVEVFGGGSVAILEDFRHLELVRNGRKKITRIRWGQDKGHKAEMQAFMDALKGKTQAPIPLEQIIGSTLTTLRLKNSCQTGQPLTVDLSEFVDSALRKDRTDYSAARPAHNIEGNKPYMLILGLNMFHADSSAAIVEDGKILFAVAEERLNRHKHYGGFPALAVKACLDAAGAKIADVEHVAVGQDSDANLAKKVQYALANPAKVLNFIKMRQRKESMRDVRSLLAKALDVDASTLKFQEHHLEHHIAHIASSYYCSPWENAAGFSYDGSGDFVSTMTARCEGSDIHVLDRVFLPHSLGSFYTMICDFIGYRKYGDEGKVMGLAPYGKDTYVDQIRKIVTLKDGTFQLNMSYFKPLGSSQGMQVLPDGTVRLARHFSDKWRSSSALRRAPR